MADRTVAVTLTVNVAGAVTGLNSVTRSAAATATGLDRINASAQHITGLSKTVGIFGAALAGVAALAVKRFADFDAAMSAVEATGDDAAASITGLRDAAIDAGARTVYSATEAAGAIEELAKAGVSASDILAGGLDGALDLAAAGAIDVADAAQIAATAMTQFELSGDDVTHVADLLAAGAGKAQGGVGDLGMALKQAGLVANQTGLTIEETTAGLTAFASAGLLGSDAGTSFKAMLQRLTPQSNEAKQAMSDLGISAYDSQGQFIGLAEFAGNLQDALRNLTPEQRNSAMATIFGSDAVRAANVLYEEGEAGVRAWTDAVDDQGFAAETAATRLDNLKGDLEKLSGAIDSAFISSGSGANEALRTLTQNVTAVVDAFNDLPEPMQQATLFLVGGTGLVALGVAGLGRLVVGIAEAKTSLTALGITAGRAKIAVAGVGGALAIATVALGIWATRMAEAQARTEGYMDTLDEFGNRTDATVEKINDALSADQRQFTERLFGKNPRSLIDTAEKYGVSIEELQNYILGVGDAADVVKSKVEAYNDQFTEQDYRAAVESSNMFVGALDREASALTDAEKQSAQKAIADKEAGLAAEDAAESFDTTTAAVMSQTEAYHELNSAQAEAAGLVLSVRDAQRQVAAATDEAKKALEDNGATLDINTEKGRENQAALDAVADAGWKLIDVMQQNGATQEEIRGVVEDTRTRFVNLATGMGMSADEANALADQLKLIPTNIQSKVEVVIQADVSSAYSVVDRFIRDVSGRTIALNVQGQQVGVMGPRGGMNAMATGGFVSGPGTGTSDSISARLSNGEYVVKAAAVSRYGRAFMDSVNTLRFASGGFVGSAPATGGGGVEAGAVNVTQHIVTPDPAAAANAVARRLTWLGV